MLSRREFLKLSAMVGAGLALPTRWLATPRRAFAASQSGALTKFVEPLRGIGGNGIPLAQPDTVNPGWWQPGATHYTIDIGQFADQLHPDLPNPTRLWGYGQGGDFKHLGGIIAAKRGTPVQITFRNNLPPEHILPVDRSGFFMDAVDHPDNRVSTHLHGGFVPWISDGGPLAFWDPNGLKGEAFLNNAVLRPGQIVPPNEAEFFYPNQQSARLMWYHDHAHDITRLNAYAGIASAYVIYDDYELALTHDGLPGPLDPRTIYLVFQDKVFLTDSNDPTFPVAGAKPGDLWYAHTYDPADLGPDPLFPLPELSVVPEFFGDTLLVNGTVYPFLEVEQRQYRLRLLNACNSRFLNPRLVYAQGPDFPNNTEPNPAKPGPAFIQIGTEGGFLPFPTMVNGPRQPVLLMGPAERADLIVDFRNIPEGATLILYNDALAPFPMGDPATGSIPGYGPDTRTLLQIRVKRRKGAADRPVTLPQKFNPTDPFILKQKPGKVTSLPRGVPVRYLTLNETFDDWGRLIQLLGTNEPAANGGFGRNYMQGATEVINQGSMEVWEILNLTGDTHPIHFHLVNGQVLSRQPFDDVNYTGGAPAYTGAPYAPDDNELGWKETVRMNPGEVTRLLMKFNLPSVPFAVPESPVNGGHEYVWHCHILEHEEHDMMRPLIVK